MKILPRIGVVLTAASVMVVASGCGGGQQQTVSNYCVDQFGSVIDYAYCAPGNSHYNSHYTYWHDSGHHKYKPGYRIPKSTFSKGTTSTKKPSATLTVPKKSTSGSSVKPSTPAKPQTAPSRSSSSSRSSTSGSTSRSSSTGGRK